MSRCIVALVLGCALIVASCSSNSSTQMLAGSHTAKSAFSVQTEPGSSFNTRLELTNAGEGTEVAIWAEDAEAITEAYLHLNYDSNLYTPVSVEIGEFLGSDVLNLAITDIAGDVPIGICQVKATAVPVSGNGLLATVTFDNEPNLTARTVSKAPGGAANQVLDLIASPNSATSATLRWTEKNNGDYDNNSEVGIQDLQPLANFIFEKVSETNDPTWAGLMDGDGNGEINTADITPIATNFGSTLKGYQVYIDSAGTTPADEASPCYCERTADVNPKVPVQYEEEVTFTAGTTPSFTVRPVSNDGTNATGTLSNAADVVIITDPPAAPSNLQALSGVDYGGEGAIRLTWTAPDSPHLSGYEIQRKLTSEGDGAWLTIRDQTEQLATSTTWTDTGLPDDSYDYRVYAWNKGSLRSDDPSNTATNTPYYAPFPSPVDDLSAASGTFDSSIHIQWTWDGETGKAGEYFHLYRKGPNDSAFNLIDTITPIAAFHQTDDLGLSEGDTYQYYVTFVRMVDSTEVEGDPSNTASAMPKESASIVITDLTTDKTTHCNDASEPASNLSVVADPTPDTVDWTASRGTITPDGTTATYVPTSGQTTGKVTITCTVHKGSHSDSATIDLYVTSATILTQYGNSGSWVPGAPELLSDGTICPTLEPLSMGGNRVENREMSYYMNADHVTYFSTFDIS